MRQKEDWKCLITINFTQSEIAGVLNGPLNLECSFMKYSFLHSSQKVLALAKNIAVLALTVLATPKKLFRCLGYGFPRD